MTASAGETKVGSCEGALPETPARQSKVAWIVQFLRRYTRWVEPWDFDEVPVRHWWDVYAK
jgi:hypothetical protein